MFESQWVEVHIVWLVAALVVVLVAILERQSIRAHPWQSGIALAFIGYILATRFLMP